MLTAIIITWTFWGLLVLLEIYWKRDWVQWLIVADILSFVWFLISLFSDSAALFSSAILHSALITFILFRIVNDRGVSDWKRP